MNVQRITALLASMACATFSALPAAIAQEAGAAFDTLSIGVRVVANVNHNTFHRYWDPHAGVEVNVATPFYLGRIEAGLHYASFSATRPEQPDFRSWFPYLGWGYDWPVATRLSWYNGIRVGDYLMSYDIPGDNKTEQELGVSLNSDLGFAILPSWSLDVSVRYRVVFTHERLRHIYIAAGLRRSLRTPRWLREFLD
ncbi:MAG: hypothetical protein JSV41_04590 [Gemmatimonadota bacterium]|nr:MAG: hypothetical protein JSV41_04590 [Gemmatimonadota bacterium]